MCLFHLQAVILVENSLLVKNCYSIIDSSMLDAQQKALL
jgi:hypothetical protein